MRWRTWTLPAAIVLATATVIGGGVLVISGGRQQARSARHLPMNTAEVERRTLSATVSQGGILTYRARSDGSPYTVINQAPGTYTELPGLGRVIAQGQVLYRVNDRPVVLLRGSTPAFRTLSGGATGPDVAELNADLVALGYAARAQLHPRSAFFGPATATAVEKLQAALGVPRNGSLGLGQVVFEPTALRVAGVSAQPGGRSQPGETVMQATSTARQVQIALPASQQTELAAGNKVTITLPSNQITPGMVSSVATTATCPSGSRPVGSSSSPAAAGTDSCSSGGSGSSTPTIAVNISFSDPAASGTWDQAPVQVGITTASVPGVLTVPVAALLALSGGGYAVEVVGAGAKNHLARVSLGLFDDADGLVQVTASGLAAGQRVVVPST